MSEPQVVAKQESVVAAQNTTPSEDLFNRVHQVKTAEAPKPAEDLTTVQPSAEYDKLTPEAKSIVDKIKKDMESGLTKKFQTIADKNKEVDALKSQLESQSNKRYTREDVKELLKRQDFIEAAQAELSAAQASGIPTNWEGSQEAWSALTTQEKAQFQSLEGKVNSLLLQNEQMQNQQEHERVKSRFKDYDPKAVEGFQSEILSGKVSNEQVKELIWKALNYETHVKNAYQLAKDEKQGALLEKFNGSTHTTTSSTQTSDEKPKMVEGERPASFFKRLGEWNAKHLPK